MLKDVVLRSRRVVARASILVAAILILTPAAFAQSLDELGISRTALHLQAGVVDTSIERNDLALFVLEQPEGAAVRRVIQLDGPLTPERERQLSLAGVTLGEYIPMHAYVANLANADAARLGQLDFIRWHGAFENAWKIAPDLGTREYDDPALKAVREAGAMPLIVSLFQGEDVDAGANSIGAIDGANVVQSWMQGDTPLVAVIIPEERIAALAGLPSVAHIAEAQEVVFRNNSTRWIVQSNVINVNTLYNNGIHGEGQVVGIMDGRPSANHCSFSDPGVAFGASHRKILAYNTSTSPISSHGTHVAGTAVGDGGQFSSTRGVAYLAKMVFNSTPGFQNQADFINRLSVHHNQGARIHTNSWGDDGTTSYSNWTRAIDVFSRNNEESAVIFAVTNLGSLRAPENAKSVLAVGASRGQNQQHLFCSGGAGPTSDGRRKPEIYAPGCGAVSSNGSGCGTVSMTGTSMAAPAVAGAMALARQYFVDGYYPSGAANASDSLVPSGALLRATLLNGAVDMTGIGGYPSNTEGWGRVLLDNGLHFVGESRTMIAIDVRNSSPESLSTSDTNEHQFMVEGSSEQLRVTMTFTDMPGNSFTAFAPINDINLEVESPSGTIYRGNFFSGGVSTTGGSFDAVNSTEQVHVNNPATGVWTARIIGAGVNQDTQGYGLVISGDVSEGSCLGDINGDSVVDGGDLANLLANWGTNNPAADFNGDGIVNGADLASLLAAWGDC